VTKQTETPKWFPVFLPQIQAQVRDAADLVTPTIVLSVYHPEDDSVWFEDLDGFIRLPREVLHVGETIGDGLARVARRCPNARLYKYVGYRDVEASERERAFVFKFLANSTTSRLKPTRRKVQRAQSSGRWVSKKDDRRLVLSDFDRAVAGFDSPDWSYFHELTCPSCTGFFVQFWGCFAGYKCLNCGRSFGP